LWRGKLGGHPRRSPVALLQRDPHQGELALLPPRVRYPDAQLHRTAMQRHGARPVGPRNAQVRCHAEPAEPVQRHTLCGHGFGQALFPLLRFRHAVGGLVRLAESYPAVIAGGEDWVDGATTDPYEVGWAREAMIVLRTLEPGSLRTGCRALVQISADGLRW